MAPYCHEARRDQIGVAVQELISTLEQTKARAVAIAGQLAAAVAASGELNAVRGRYRPAARRGALLFFALAGLATVSCMYEHSLAAFLAVFSQTLDAATPDADVARRLASIMAEATERVFRYACLGLFERHKLMFAAHLALRIQVLFPAELWFTWSNPMLMSVCQACSMHTAHDVNCTAVQLYQVIGRRYSVHAAMPFTYGMVCLKLTRHVPQTAAADLPAWQLDFFLKGSLRLQRSPRSKPHAWLSDQVLLPLQTSIKAVRGASYAVHGATSLASNVCTVGLQLRGSKCNVRGTYIWCAHLKCLNIAYQQGMLRLEEWLPIQKFRRCISFHLALFMQGWDDLVHLAELAASQPCAGLSAEAAEALQAAEQCPANHPLAAAADAVERDGAAWRAYCTLEAPESAPLPGGLSDSLSALEQLLVRPRPYV